MIDGRPDLADIENVPPMNHPRDADAGVTVEQQMSHPTTPSVSDRPGRLDQLALLYAMADHIQRARHVDVIYEEAVSGLRKILQADRAAILIQEGDGVMRFKAWENLSSEYRSAVEGHSPWQPRERDPRPVLVEDAADGSLGELEEVVRREGIGALAFIPLLHRGRLLGKLMIYYDRPRTFLPEEIRLAEAIASHVSFSIWRGRADADQAELLRRFEAERSVLESVVKQMPAGVLMADAPSGRIIMSNPQVDATWGRSLRHASSVEDYAAWEGVRSDGTEMAAADWPLARSVRSGETVQGEEIRIRRGDGSEGVVRMSSAPVRDSQGRQLAAVATVYDITDEVEAERDRVFLEEATRALNASLDLEETLEDLARLVVGRYADWCVIHRVEADRVINSVSVHRDPQRDTTARALVGRSFRMGDDGPVSWAIRERKPVLGPEVTDELLHMVYPSDAERRENVRGMGTSSFMVLPLVARDRPLGAVSLMRSEGRYAGKDLDLMTEFARRAALAVDNAILYGHAKEADSAKANFLAVMSHEFRTPLSAILGYSDILTAEVHGELNTMQRRHLERVKASVRHLSHLVDEILSFASMEAGRERVRKEPVEVVSLAAEAASIMEPIAEASGLELRVRLPTRPINTMADGSKVNQILINLLSNAIKYTPHGHVEMSVLLEGDGLRCSVTDTGPGIAPEHMENVFTPFWQVERSDGRRISGTGLGLSVARRLARLMDGDVTLKSVVGEGSTFTLELPIEAQPEVADGAPS